jgi:hypothetical protein
MARTLANAQLQSLYGGATQGLEQSRLSALAELQNQIATARLAAEQARVDREQTLQDAIATNLGTGYTCPPGFQKDAEGNCVPIPKTSTDGTGTGTVTGTGTATTVKRSPSVAALAAIPVKASNTALQKRIADFVAAKPRATPAAVAKEFPQLAANIAKKKK